MDKEQQFVVDTFIEKFSDKKREKIILYGIGKNTEAILKNVEGFNIVGLMDPNTEGQVVYGLPVLSIDWIDSCDDKGLIIVIIARDSVISIIYKRIEGVCSKKKISVYDYKGRDISAVSEFFEQTDNPYWGESFETLLRAIDDHDVVSFDIFDTLLMRKVLYPTDVFDLTERKIKKRGMDISFSTIRKESENTLADKYPNLDDIYEEMKKRLSFERDDVEVLLDAVREIEEKTDYEQLLLREDMAKALEYAVSKKKKVYILSDMYYSSCYLAKLLDDFGIKGYEKIFVSNEIKCTKEEGGAYDYFAQYVSNESSKLLHIGDNRRADRDKAIDYGLDTFHIYSGYELLQASSLQNLLIDTTELETRCIIGLLVAKMFNSPFSISSEKGLVKITNLEQMGYCFVAPMLLEFTKWMDGIIRSENVKTLLLPSRDGYLIYKIYSLFDTAVKRIYFRASRRSVTVAGLRNRDDIDRIASRGFNGIIADFLQERFGVNVSESYEKGSLYITANSDKEKEAVINEFEEAILDRAASERKNYISYLNKKGINVDMLGENSLLFDFVTSGTVLFNLSHLFNNDLRGICFATMNLPNRMYEENTDRILAAYGNVRSYGNTTMLAEHYLVLETILTDERESLVCIDDSGEEIFEGDGWNEGFDQISKIHTGIMKYAKDYMDVYGDIIGFIKASLTSADKILGLLFSSNVIVEDELKSLFKNDDVYDGIKQYQVWK